MADRLCYVDIAILFYPISPRQCVENMGLTTDWGPIYEDLAPEGRIPPLYGGEARNTGIQVLSMW